MANLKTPVIPAFDTHTPLMDKEAVIGVGVHRSQIKWFQQVGIGLNASAQIVSVPASSTANGVPNQIAYDASFLYVCVAPNTWRRVALSAF